MKLDFKNKKTQIILLIIGLVLLAGGTTFAFFVLGVPDPAETEVNLGTETSGGLTFTAGDPVTIFATLENFAEYDGSLSAESTTTVNLKAPSDIGSASENYYVYFNVTENNFVYTYSKSVPEMILTITDPEGNIVTSAPEVDYVSTIDALTGRAIAGFDITDYKGLITIASPQSISTTNSTVGTSQEWTAKITFVNLDILQEENEGKNLLGNFLVQKEEFKYPVTDYILMGYDALQVNSSDTSNVALSAKGLLHHTPELTNGAGDNNYRYSGSNEVVSNNWVCFGSDEATCPEENKYRIIGIYDGSVKLIKSTSVSSKVWDADNSNDYEPSDMNAYLNGKYYNTIPSIYQTMIKESIWNVGGNDSFIETAYEFYRDNIGTPVINKTSIGKIGLMYPSDYGFAAYTDAWTTDLYAYSNQTIKDNNWMFTGITEWTIVPHSSTSNNVWVVPSYENSVGYHNAYSGSASRPVFYLESSAKILSGTGSEADPFRIGM